MSDRPRISEDFLLEQRRRRVMDGAARAIVDLGYHATTVTDIVRETAVARNTFYECFASKRAVALAMVAAVCPALDLGEGDIDADGSIVLAVEIAARLRSEEPGRALLLITNAARVLWHPVDVDALEDDGAAEDPTLAKLPPGRHGLGREFVRENQRRRLLAGAARAIHEHGYWKVTIADIVDAAAVSRRTFYEHFTGKYAAVVALVEEHADVALDFDSGLGCLWAEIVAAAFDGDHLDSERRRRGGQAVLRMLRASVESAEAA